MSKKKRRTAQNSQNMPAVMQENTVSEEKITEEMPVSETAKYAEAAAEREETVKSEKTEVSAQKQPDTASPQPKPKASKGVIAGFSVMGAAIICIIVGLVVTNINKKGESENAE